MKPIGILGGGQLARMLALAAHPLGLRCRVLDPAENPPAAAVAEHVRGDLHDLDILARFAEGLELATCEIEHLPDVTLDAVARLIDVRPGPRAIKVARDRLIEKSFVRDVGIPTAEFAAVGDLHDLEEAIVRLGLPLILKTRTDGYDGRGQLTLRSRADAVEALARLGGRPLIAEALVEFDRELSIAVARSRHGEFVSYPLVENHHFEGVLRWTAAPAPNVGVALQARAEAIARALTLSLAYVGVLVVELFQVGERLLVNEIAPRVHNSAHWTIEGSDTSQFENHLRAILGLPLGATTARDSWLLFNLLGDEPDLSRVLELPGAHLHVYGKTPRPGRKIGHVTCRAPDPYPARARLQSLLGLP